MARKTIGREVELASDRFLARDRMPIFLGSDMPQTIVMKEVIDNEIDIVGEKTQPATKAIIKLGPQRLKVMDNGLGISADIRPGEDKSSLWYACAKMFTSSNYTNNASDTLGANGVGLTLSNYTSKEFTILNFNGKNVRGYHFIDGYLSGSKEDDVPEEIKELPSGDFVEHPLSFEEANEKFKPMFEKGFFVDVIWNEAPNSLFNDNANLEWLYNYIKIRTGEIANGEIEVLLYSDNSLDDSKLLKHNIYNKDKNSEFYVKSWDEQVKDYNSVLIKDGAWTIAFSTNPDMKVESICQGAPIKSRYVHTLSIQIQDYDISVSVPFSMKYNSDTYPPYSDQTKVNVRFPYSVAARTFEKSDYVYKHFYHEAEKHYMAKVIADSDSTMFWPSLGPAEESELIIAEGYSAISGLKSQRDPHTQACIALRGKITNCWNMDMVKAMRSDIVKQMLNAVIINNYKRVIIATDADEDGAHIAALLIALFYRFTNLIGEGKLYRVHTPLFIFKKRGDIKWSDYESDCPSGYHSSRMKGLGGLSAEEVGLFVMNKETRDLIKIIDDPEAWDYLDLAFTKGGEDWIINE